MEQKKSNSNSFLPICFAIASLILMVILKIVLNFGGGNYILYGVFTIIILGLPIVGGILSYFKNKDFKSLNFIFNAVTLALALIVL